MSKSPSIKVLIVDDHQVVREGLRRILEMDKQIQVIGEARSGEEAIVKTNALVPDVVIMENLQYKLSDTLNNEITIVPSGSFHSYICL